MMKYNDEELRILRKIRKKKYATLEDWEKFYIKDNVRLWRQRKKDLDNLDLFDPQILDGMRPGARKRRATNGAQEE